ncbi:Anhydro-N-acetylmuramic acid kinase [Rickettsiales bacterium Ac37b]|nr:Anhydro-N-acetylmuramic acid kinase [Rickettsiales bacterium Ac37b]
MTILKCIGLMSGTSMDGIDAVLLETDGKTYTKQLSSLSLSYDNSFRSLLKAAELVVRKYKGNLELAQENYQNLSDIIATSTISHTKIVKKLLEKSLFTAKEIDVIGYHGQSLYHNPEEKITISVGYSQLLANNTGIPVVANFRERDVKNGGQGAPFAPIYHQALAIRDKRLPIAVVNCGGIANVTFIRDSNPNNLIGFDTGPGNVLIDQYIRKFSNNTEFMDKDGKHGKLGKMHDNIFKTLYNSAVVKNNVNYLNSYPPKSLDSSNFILTEEIFTLTPQDACRTLAAFTAYIIAECTKFITFPSPLTWVMCGGGFNNPVIVTELNKYIKEKLGEQAKIIKASSIGWDSQYMEAEIFAYIAARTMLQLPSSFPQITNVKSPTIAGDIFLPHVDFSHDVSKI